MQVHPHCGDGVEISVLYSDSEKDSTEVLHAAEYAVQQTPVRQRVLFFLDHLHTGWCIYLSDSFGRPSISILVLFIPEVQTGCRMGLSALQPRL